MTQDLIGFSVPFKHSAVAHVAFTGVVARFTDADGNTDHGAYAASIHWGDGSSSVGAVVIDPTGGFDVVGSHTFPLGGAYRVTARIGDVDGDSTATATTNIVDQAPITATNVPVTATAGIIADQVVARFASADVSLPVSAFAASIDWGDGRTSPGSIIPDRLHGGFDVLGSHIYRQSGAFTIHVKIQQGNGPSTFFTVSNLISDGAVNADHVIPNFVNPWGLVAPNPGDFWDGNNGSGSSTVFDSAGNQSVGLPIVHVPPPHGSTATSAPTGVVFSGSGFNVTDGHNTGASIFLFATEDGTISGWNPTVNGTGTGPSTQATLAVDESAANDVFKGLALLTIPAGDPIPAGRYLFATDFRHATLDVFDTNFQPVNLSATAFHDATTPAGFAPFGVQAVNGNLYVTYAKQDAAKHDDVAGAGNGFVDVFAPSGALIRRLGGTGRQMELNSPWGVTQAPASFGAFSNDILVGNFGDSHISAFDPNTGAFLGQLSDARGHAITLDGGVPDSDHKGLWGVFGFGNSNPPGPANAIFFASGINDEGDGLFGSLTATSVASATTTGSVTVRSHG
jgi:uncharacterized protein (TIGR03118 family)